MAHAGPAPRPLACRCGQQVAFCLPKFLGAACVSSLWTRALDRAPLTRPPAACRGSAPPTESEPDEAFEWVTPDESTRLPFVRSPDAALQLAQEWDLCISGDGLLHLQHIGAEAAYIPLAQVRVSWGACCICATGVHSQCEQLLKSVWRSVGVDSSTGHSMPALVRRLGGGGHSSLCSEDQDCPPSVPACSQPHAACPAATAGNISSALLPSASLHSQNPGLALLLVKMVLRHTSVTLAGPLVPAR